MQVNLKSFCSDIRRAEPESCLDSSGVSPYLMQNLFIPFMSGKDVKINSLDYDKFTMSDMNDLYMFMNDAGFIEQKLEPMRSRLQKCSPVARRSKSFC